MIHGRRPAPPLQRDRHATQIRECDACYGALSGGVGRRGEAAGEGGVAGQGQEEAGLEDVIYAPERSADIESFPQPGITGGGGASTVTLAGPGLSSLATTKVNPVIAGVVPVIISLPS